MNSSLPPALPRVCSSLMSSASMHTEPAHRLLWQSPLTLHALPEAQSGHDPPQSTSVSLPPFSPSVHEDAQCALMHDRLTQSVSPPHFSPRPQGGHDPPPQSTSVSAPFCTVSVHCAATQMLLTHTLLAQSDPVTHSTHLPAAEQTLAPAPPTQGVPVVTGTWVGDPAEQPSVVHWLLSLDSSPSSGIEPALPEPSHTASLQSPGVWAASGVPCAVSSAPQTPPVQVRFRHSVSWPGHCETLVQGEPPLLDEVLLDVLDEVLLDVLDEVLLDVLDEVLLDEVLVEVLVPPAPPVSSGP